MTLANSVVVPGNHDGVHLGHRSLLALAREHAEGARVVALTFWPHPLALLRPERAPPAITTCARRVELLAGAGADEVVIATFDADYAAQSAEAWARDRLLGDLGARAVVVGPDYRFGKDRKGSPELLRALGLTVIEAGPVDVAGGRVSSTRVRTALSEGDVALAANLMDRYHDLDGQVVKGAQRGRTIGFPTANLAIEGGLLPKDGVYAVLGVVDGERTVLRGAANLGTRPTFAAGRSLEVHFLDTDRDLYGRTVRVGFVGRLRDEQKFDGVPSLVAQLGLDVAHARQVLDAADPARFTWLFSTDP